MRALEQTIIAILVAVLASANVSAEEWAGDTFHAEWIGAQLRALREPLLQDAKPDSGEEIYRMTALPSFEHPISIRVMIGVSARAVVRMTDGWGGYGPGRLAFGRMIPVSNADIAGLRSAIDEVRFWQMPTDVPLREVIGEDGTVKVTVCADGTLVVIEALAGGRYHIVHRSCSSSDELRPVVDVFKHIARRHLPADVDEYVP